MKMNTDRNYVLEIGGYYGDKLVSLPIDSKEIQLADGQAVYIEGYNICLI